MNTILEAYLIALFVFIHFSLLLCEQPTCFFNANQFVVLPAGVYKTVSTLFNMIPIELEVIQLVAQFCLFGDLILVILLVLKIIGNILRNLLVILGITSLIMLAMYAISNYDAGMTQTIIQNAKNYVSNFLKQTTLQKWLWDKITSIHSNLESKKEILIFYLLVPISI